MTAPEMTWLGADRGSGWKYGYWDTWGQSDMKDRVQYTRTDLCIRRDDPALRQVMGSLTFLEKQLVSHGFRDDGPMLSAVSGALAAMQELIGGNE